MIVYVCSRYRSDKESIFKKQLDMTKKISKEIVEAGNDVIVPHLYYTSFLNDKIESERKAGTESALRLIMACNIVCAYVGMGISKGMEAEIEKAKQENIETYFFKSMIELRQILKKAEEHENTNL